MTTTVGVGFSQAASPKEAGHNAMQQALESFAGQAPGFVLLLSTADMEPSEILSGVQAVSQAPLIGGCEANLLIQAAPQAYSGSQMNSIESP